MLTQEQQIQLAALPPEQRTQLEQLIANPPAGMQPQKVVDMVLKQAAETSPAPTPAPTPPPNAPAPAPAPAAEQAAADAQAQAGTPAPKKATKADRTKLIIACASGGLNIEATRQYLELLG
jgi:cell division protein FtsN